MQTKAGGRSVWRPAWLVLTISLLVMGFMIWNVIFVQNQILHRGDKNRVQQQSEDISAQVGRINQETEKLAWQLAGDDRVIEALRQGDDEQLVKSMPPLFKQWQRYGVSQLSLVAANGKALWSSQAGIEVGNDMSYQRIINKSLRQKISVAAIESSDDNCLLVTTRPLFYNDKYIGLCKVGVSMSYLGNRLQESGSGQYALFGLNGIDSILLWRNQVMQSSLNTVDIKRLHDGEEIYRSLDRNMKMLVIPLRDIDGVTVAYVQNQFVQREMYHAKMLNYLMLLLAFLFILLANYICGKGAPDYTDDFGADFARMAKINRVAFDITAGKPPQSNQDENIAGN